MNGTMPASSDAAELPQRSRTSFRADRVGDAEVPCASGPAGTTCRTSSAVIVGCPIA